jgi:hypothetical protein
MGWVINECLSLPVLQPTVLFILFTQVKSRRKGCRILRESAPQHRDNPLSKSEAKLFPTALQPLRADSPSFKKEDFNRVAGGQELA